MRGLQVCLVIVRTTIIERRIQAMENNITAVYHKTHTAQPLNFAIVRKL